MACRVHAPHRTHFLLRPSLPNTSPSSNVVHVALAVEYEGCSFASFVRRVNACAVRVEAVWCLESTDARIVVCGWLCCIT